MLDFFNEKGVIFSGLTEISETNGINGERSVSGVVLSNDTIIHGIAEGWKLHFNDEIYVITYAVPVDNGQQMETEFDAVHQFFYDFDKSSIHKELNGVNTFENYLNFVFENSGYSYRLESPVNAFEKVDFGYKSRLELFKDLIKNSGLEYSISGKIVRILEKTGTDLSTIVKKGFNLQELKLEKDIKSFVTYQKGYGAYFDENDHSKGRLIVEYLSPLAAVYGKLEAPPLIDERYTNERNFFERIKSNIDNSYEISVQVKMEDLTEAGYKQKRPVAGDYIMAINDDINFRRKIRIVSFSASYDIYGHVLSHDITCNSIGTVKRMTSDESQLQTNVNEALEQANKAQEQANSALISADGRNTTFYGLFPPNGEGEPIATKAGDMWYKPNGEEDDLLYWNGAEWRSYIDKALISQIKDNIVELEKETEQNKSDIQESIQKADNAVIKANQAITDAGFAKNQATNAQSEAIKANLVAQEVKKQAAELLGKVTTVEGSITTINKSVDQVKGELVLKADQTEFNKLNGIVKNQGTLITQHTKEIGFKANQTDVNTLTNKVIANEGKLTVQSDKIQGLVTKTDGQTTDIANLKVTANGLSSTVSKVENELSNLEIGGRNIFRGSNESLLNRIYFSNVVGNKQLIKDLTSSLGLSIEIKINTVSSGNLLFYLANLKSAMNFEKGKIYSMSIDIKSDVKVPISGITINQMTVLSSKLSSMENKFKRLSIVFTPLVDSSEAINFNTHFFVFSGDINKYIGKSVFVSGFKVEQGNKATDWSPAPEDLATQIQISSIEQTVKGIQSTVANKAEQSQVTQLSGQITSVVAELGNMEIGGRNLLTDSNVFSSKFTAYGGANISYTEKVSIPEWGAKDATRIKVVGGTSTIKMYRTLVYPSIAKQKYTLSIWIKNEGNSEIVISPNIGEWQRIRPGDSRKVISKSTGNGISNFQLNIQTNKVEDELQFVAWRIMAETGNQVNDWSPSPDEMANKSQITQLSNQITLEVNAINKNKADKTQINLLQDQINLRVKKGDAISQINIEANKILVSTAGKLILDATTTVISNALIKSAMIENLTADKINTGTLNAGTVNLINMNANNITSGYLNSDRIEARSITADKLTANAIQIGFNNMGTAMKLTPYNLNFYSESRKIMEMDSRGITYLNTNGSMLGNIGRQSMLKNPNVQGLSFDLETNGDYMSWSYQRNSTDNYYTMLLTLDARGRAYGTKGIYADARMFIRDGMTVSGPETVYQTHIEMNEYSIKKPILQDAGIHGSFIAYNGVSAQFYRNINMNGYSITGSSGYSKKENFVTMNPDASLYYIVNTDVVGYNYKENPEVFNVGFVINDSGQSPYHTDKNLIRSKEYRDDSLLVGHLMLAVKSLNKKIASLESDIRLLKAI